MRLCLRVRVHVRLRQIVTLFLWGCCVNAVNGYRTHFVHLRQIVYFDVIVNEALQGQI